VTAGIDMQVIDIGLPDSDGCEAPGPSDNLQRSSVRLHCPPLEAKVVDGRSATSAARRRRARSTEKPRPLRGRQAMSDKPTGDEAGMGTYGLADCKRDGCRFLHRRVKWPMRNHPLALYWFRFAPCSLAGCAHL
jgi:hypothetical protein